MIVTTSWYDTSTSTASTERDRLAVLRSQLMGELITADSPLYDAARQVQNVTVDRRPLAIVRAENSEDVAAAVRFARDQGLALGVRSGGHSLARLTIADGAVVVDLSQMKRIAIHPETRICRIQTGATSADVGAAAQEFGLALSTGDTSSVGMGGLATGGGIGFMVRKYGLTIDSLLSARVVTANGEIVTASPTEHPDLFWAIRGGGGNFGIVAELELRLAPVAQILGGEIVLPATREVLRGYLEYTASAPDDLSTIGNLMHAPPFPHVPPELVGEVVFSVLVCWSGGLEEGERALAPLRALATPLLDRVSPMPYPRIYDFTAHQAVRHAWAIRSMFSDELSDAALDASLASIRGSSSPYSIIHFRGLGGALARVARDETAFVHRSQRYLLGIIGLWMDADEDPEPHRAWVQSLWQQVRHEGEGVYMNFLEDEGDARIREAYSAATYARLREIKRRYDPRNLFTLNQNVPPRS